ncbi:MAG: Histidine kinase [Chthoniobacteraceae bacterium]|nr:Histidine kinase [Chthoniobacteraceae bacterium]
MNALQNFIRDARFLIIDDELANVRLLEGNLEEEGQLHFCSTTDPRQAFALFEKFEPDIILLDLMMPHLDGFAVMEQLLGRIAPDQFLPIIVLTADVSPGTKKRALTAGARDFLTKPFDATELHLRVKNLLELRYLHRGLQNQNRRLDAVVAERTKELESTLAELKTSQQQAILQERLHAFSEMASGVVHDFNNSLGILLGYSDLLLETDILNSRERTIKCIQAMNTASQDAAQVVRRLRHFYRPRHEDDLFEIADLRMLLDQASHLSKPRWKDQALAEGRVITVKLELEKVPAIACNPSEMREVMINLIFNAIDAMPEGGTLTLRTGASANRSVFEISDTGHGMSEEVRGRCLEPFYTTKGEKGTGLGLAMVFGIVRRHGGTVEIESEPEVGSTFRVSLPQEGAPAMVAAAQSSRMRRSLQVLIVDDDEQIREILSEILERAGHIVTTASDGHEALLTLQSQKFDLLLTDFSMPKMHGGQLAHAAREVDATLPIIMTTGFGEMMLPDGKRPAGVDLLLEKPVSAERLKSAIAQVVSE